MSQLLIHKIIINCANKDYIHKIKLFRLREDKQCIYKRYKNFNISYLTKYFNN